MDLLIHVLNHPGRIENTSGYQRQENQATGNKSVRGKLFNEHLFKSVDFFEPHECII